MNRKDCGSMAKININGKIQSDDQPVIKVKNRAFRYGDSLFESIRIVNGELCNFNQHYQRLLQGMQTLQMSLNPNLKPGSLFNETRKLIAENDIQQGGRVRITVFRDGGGYYTPESNESAFLIEAERLPDNYYKLNEEGLSIDTFIKIKKCASSSLSALKSGNALLYVMAALYKKENNLGECILVNECNRLCEAISANIFIYKNGTLYTPELAEGCLPGVMRWQVMQLGKEKGLNVVEGTYVPTNLLQADEVFLTNSIKGIQWVMTYKQKRYYNNISTMMTEMLNQHFAAISA